MKRKLPNFQFSWEDPYKEVDRMSDVIYRIQKNPRCRIMVIYL
jgi:hypothetical protein